METLRYSENKPVISSQMHHSLQNIKPNNVDNSYCLLKTDSDQNNNSGRTVSLILTRVPNANSNHIHVLCCQSCNYSTLSLLNFKEHIKHQHASVESILTYSCPQCGGLSTEKHLMEEHMKIYHPMFDTSKHKLLKKHHKLSSSEPPSFSPMLSSSTTVVPSSSVTNGGIRIQLASAPPAAVSSASNLEIFPNPPLSTENTHSIIVSSSEDHMETETSPPVHLSPSHSNTPIQGSRRRKAAVPGKLPMKMENTSNDNVDDSEPITCKKIKIDDELLASKPPSSSTMTLPVIDPGTGRYVWLMTGQSDQQPQILQSSSTPRSGGMIQLADVVAEALRNVVPSTMTLQTSQSSTSPIMKGTTMRGISNQSPPVTSSNRTVFITSDGPAKNILNQLIAAANLNSLDGSSQITGASSMGNEQALDMSMRPTTSGRDIKTEVKLNELIQDQAQTLSTNGDGCSTQDALRTALLSGVAPMSTDSSNCEKNPTQLLNFSNIQAILAALAKTEAVKDGNQLFNLPANVLTSVSPYSDPIVHPQPSLVSMETATSTPMNFSTTGFSFPQGMGHINTNTLKGITLPNGEYIPVTSLLPGHNSNHLSFGAQNNLVSFVTGLSTANLATSAASRGVPSTTSTHRNVNFADFSVSTSTPTIKFDAHQALMVAAQNGAVNALNMVDSNPLRPSGTAIGFFESRNGLQSVTLGFPPEFKFEAPISSSSGGQCGLREVHSLANLDEHGNLDGSLLSTSSNSTTNILGGQLNGSIEDDGSEGSGDESESPNSSELQQNRGDVDGSAKKNNGRSGGKRSGGVGSRPHRQNFTPTQNRILTEWYATHQYKPYPSTDDTKALAIKSELTYSQVKKWFANKRARTTNSGLPKPIPPTAPDDVQTDASATAAFVAAAVAAASALSDDSQLPSTVASSLPSLLLRPPLPLTLLAPRPSPLYDPSAFASELEPPSDERQCTSPISHNNSPSNDNNNNKLLSPSSPVEEQEVIENPLTPSAIPTTITTVQ